jgi:septum formation protein
VNKLRLVLASGSPRRKDLLETVGIKPLVVPSELDETCIDTKELTPGRLVADLACRKAKKVAGMFPSDIVLGADTIVVLDGEVLGKPGDPMHARSMLEKLSGRTHYVYTGIALYQPETGEVFTDVDCSCVTMRKMDTGEIEWYVSTNEPMGKAGSYAIQGRAALFITGIKGDYTSVIGLPIPKLYEILIKAGVEIRNLIGS